jgi:translation elongation factor EF-G
MDTRKDEQERTITIKSTGNTYAYVIYHIIMSQSYGY